MKCPAWPRRESLQRESHARSASRARASVDVHDRAEQLDRFDTWPLKRVPSDDRAETAASLDRAHFLDKFLVGDFWPARENHDASPVEAALDHMTYAIGELLKRYVVGLIAFFASGCSRCELGSFTLTMLAPSWAAICAA